ncbi:hypothetical protein D9O50_16960 [Oxalobacteraceae bacterium CAVE-383]|nr:hypothetical protein D9O50_16960 [Oxalobacteraceae bacterium CAVE-383]
MSERALRQQRHAQRLRLFAASAALLGWLGLGLQLWVVLQTRHAAGLGALGGLINFLGYFTIWSNLLASIALSCQALQAQSRFALALTRPGAMTGIACCVALVGLTYHAVLSRFWNPAGTQLLADNLLHSAVPALFLIFWWLFVAPARAGWRSVLHWALLPAAYLIVALLRGAVDGFYAYPFIDAIRLGYGRVFVNAAAALSVFSCIGAVLILLDKRKR